MSRPSKPVSTSKTTLSSQMMPVDANPMGNVHGGTILKLVDVAAGVTALRHARSVVVTASIDRMDFYQPVDVPDIIPETPEEKRRWREGKQRRAERLRILQDRRKKGKA